MMTAIMAVKHWKSHIVSYGWILFPSNLHTLFVLLQWSSSYGIYLLLNTRDKRIQLRDASIFLPLHSELYPDLKSAILAVAA